MIKKVTIILAFLSLSLIVVLCGQSQSQTDDNSANAQMVIDTASIHVEEASASDIQQMVSNSEADVVLLNVWATWCQPCREEFPDLLRLYETYQDQGFELMLVSADFESVMPDVKEFLANHQVDFPTYIKTGSDNEFIMQLSQEWTGALPATFVYDQDGNMLEFWQGKANYEKLEQVVTQYLEVKEQT